MPRTLIRHPEADRGRSLGFLAVWWIESFVVHGRGDVAGQPVRYGDEYAGFVVDCYALSGSGERLVDSAFLSRPKGTDKSGIAAALCLFEAFGPCRFAGFAEGGETYTFLGQTYTYEPGEPMGKPVVNPYVRVMATEETQTGNVYDSIYFNLKDDDAPLHALVQGYGVDPGLTRVLIPKAAGGGEIVPSTAGAASKDGGLETFAVFDESHLYNTPQLRQMYRTVTRNTTKRRKTAGTWFIETTTMYAPGEESVAEQTYELGQLISEGKVRRPRLLFDHRWGDPGPVVKGEGESEKAYVKRLSDAFADAYGDALEWNSVDALLNELWDTRNPEAETRRYFFNALVAAANAWVEPSQWDAVSVKQSRLSARAEGREWSWLPPAEGDVVTLGFDGGRSDDATVLVACRVSDNYVFPLMVQEAPDSKEALSWEVDRDAVDAAVAAAHERFEVAAFFADPPFWQDYLDRWEREFSPGYRVRASQSGACHWWTNRDKPMVEALERAHTAIVTGGVLHGSDPVLTRHVMNARRWRRRSGVVIGKDRRGSGRKMDAAMGMVLALEAAARVRAVGDVSVKRPSDADFVPFSPRANGRGSRA